MKTFFQRHLQKSPLLLFPLLTGLGFGQGGINPGFTPSSEPECEECGVPVSCSSIKSFHYIFDCGEAVYSNQADFLRISRSGYQAGSFAGGMPLTVQRIMTRTFDNEARSKVILRVEEPEFTSDLYDKSCLTISKGSNAQVIEQGNKIQIKTLTHFVEVVDLASPRNGFSMTKWSLDFISPLTMTGSLYDTPAEASLGKAIFEEPDPLDNAELKITEEETEGYGLDLSTRVRHTLYDQTLDGSGKLQSIDALTYVNDGTSDILVEATLLSYSAHGAKKWDYTIDRKIYRASTINGVTTGLTKGSWNSANLVSHTEEIYSDFSLSPAGGESAASRLIKRTRNPDEVNGSKLVESWGYLDEDDTPGGHGRLLGYSRSDGYWESYEIDTSEISQVTTEIKWSSWGNVPASQKNQARKVETVTTGTQVTETEYLNLKKILTRVTTRERDGNLMIRTIKETTSINENSGEPLTTVEAYHSSVATGSDAVSRFKAGRRAYVLHPDGTATTYGYSTASGGMIAVQVDTGAGDETGITAGMQWNRIYTPAEILRKETAFSSDDYLLIVNQWEGKNPDTHGRPTRIEYFNNANDFSEKYFSCCGLESSVDRQGVVRSYVRDPLRRVISVETDLDGNSSGSVPVVTRTTDYDKLTMTNYRQSGAGARVLVNEVTRSLNGRLVSRTGADEDDDGGTSETSTMAYTNATTTTGEIATETRPDSSTVITERFLDGRTRRVTGTAVEAVAFDYGLTSYNTHEQEIRTTHKLANQTGYTSDEWQKDYRDGLGMLVKTEFPADTVTPAITRSYHYRADSSSPATPAGSRGKLKSVTDLDGVTTSYSYNSEGELHETTRPMPDGEPDLVTRTETGYVNYSSYYCRRQTTTLVSGSTAVVAARNWTDVRGFFTRSESFGVLNGESETDRGTVLNDGDFRIVRTDRDGTGTVNYFTGNQNVASTRWTTSATPPATAPADIQNVTTTGFVTGTSRTYDGFGRLATMTDARTGTVTYSGVAGTGYTDSDNLLGMVDSGGRATAYGYDVMGRRVGVDAPDSNSFDGTNAQSLANISGTSYDSAGRMQAQWGDGVNARFYRYDQQGRLTELRTYQGLAHGTEPVLGTGGYAATTWTYHSARGWLIEKTYSGEANDHATDPDYSYHPSGRLKTRTWERGATTTYNYDQGKLDTVVYSDGTPDVDYTYDEFGRLLTVKQGHNTTGPSHQWDYEYDPATFVLDQETVSYDTTGNGTGDFTRIITRDQDSITRQSRMQVGTSGSSALDYDLRYYYESAGRLQQVRDRKRGNRYYTYHYHANAASQVQYIRLAHRRSGDTPSGGVWDETGRMWRSLESDRNALSWTGLGFKGNTAGNRSRYDYTTNAIGQRTGVATSGSLIPTGTGEWDWKYNARGEVVSADANWDSSESSFYEFDGIGNRDFVRSGTATTTGGTLLDYSANAGNQYTTLPGVAATPTHDVDGNADSYPLPVAPTVLADFDWNGENRLTKVTRNDNTEVEFQYDYLGRRISKTVDGTASQWFVYDGWNMIAEYTQSGTATPAFDRRFVWGPDLAGQSGGSAQGAGGVGGLLAIYDNGKDYLPAYDGNGNITGIVRVNTGGGDGFSHVASYTYDAFGNLIDSQDLDGSGYVNDNPFRFSTKYHDSETGLYYYGYRYYDPATGRWPSRDPLKEQGIFISSEIDSMKSVYLSDLENSFESGNLTMNELAEKIISFYSYKSEWSFERVEQRSGLNNFTFSRNNAISYYDILGQAPGAGISAGAGVHLGLVGIEFSITKSIRFAIPCFCSTVSITATVGGGVLAGAGAGGGVSSDISPGIGTSYGAGGGGGNGIAGGTLNFDGLTKKGSPSVSAGLLGPTIGIYGVERITESCTKCANDPLIVDIAAFACAIELINHVLEKIIP